MRGAPGSLAAHVKVQAPGTAVDDLMEALVVP